MSKHKSRRDFLRTTLGLAVVAPALPGVIFGRVFPTSLYRTSSGTLAATYAIRVSDYPNLGAGVGGSIKLTTLTELLMNPDHCSHSGLDNEDYPIVVTRVGESGTDAYVAVSSYCTHGEGFQLNDFDPERMLFECPHEMSTFTAAGVHDSGPAEGNLLSFPTEFDGVDTITISNVLVNCETSDINDAGDIDGSTGMLVLGQNYPNPFTDSTVIQYTLPGRTHVSLTLLGKHGEDIKMLVNKPQESGTHYVDVHMRDLPSGTYIYVLTTDFGTRTRKMTLVK